MYKCDDHDILIRLEIGRLDNKIRCYTWQHEHLTENKYKELKKLINKGVTQIDRTYEIILDYPVCLMISKMEKDIRHDIDYKDKLESNMNKKLKKCYDSTRYKYKNHSIWSK